MFNDLANDLMDSAWLLVYVSQFLVEADDYLTEAEAQLVCTALRLAGFRIKDAVLLAYLTGSGGRG
jgi:hypothetical protein